eukprot:4194785-Amphidinium_carterae.1
MIRRPQRCTQGVSSAASDVYKRQVPKGQLWQMAVMMNNGCRKLRHAWRVSKACLLYTSPSPRDRG